MMISLYSDILNIVAGAFLNCFQLFGILLSIGYIVLHLGSISYLIFHRKLGFRYDLKTSRILILVPQMYLLICSQVWIGPPRDSASFVPGITKICLIIGFLMSLVCMLSVIFSEYCVCNCREEVKRVKADGDSNSPNGGIVIEPPLKPEPIYDEVIYANEEAIKTFDDAEVLTLENMNCQVSFA